MPEEINVTTKQYVSKENLTKYDEKIKALINDIVNTSATTIQTQVNANKSSIDILNGDISQAGSVAKQVADAVATIVAEAPAAYDTLKEISDWISSHSNDASAMNTSILANTAAIDSLKKLVGTLPNGTAAKTIIEYIDTKVAGVKDWSSDISTAKSEAIAAAASDATTKANTAKSEAIAAAEEDATTKANQALADAKTYADGLAKNYATAAQGTKADSAVQPENLGSAAYMNLTEVSEDYINGLFPQS